MRKVFKKALAVTMAATMVVGLAACGSSEPSDKGASKSEFQSGHQQMYLDHSVKRCWTKQQRHWT